MIQQLLQTNGLIVRLGAPFPGAILVQADGQAVKDDMLVRMIIERPESQNDEGDEATPAHFECWTLPLLFEQALNEHMLYEVAVANHVKHKNTPQASLAPLPSSELTQKLIENQTNLEKEFPKISCHRVFCTAVVSVGERVPVPEAWKTVAEALADAFGLAKPEEDVDDADDADDEPVQQQVSANGGA